MSKIDLKNNIEIVKKEILEIFIKDDSSFPIETVLGNELLQRILDAVHEFESKYEN